LVNITWYDTKTTAGYSNDGWIGSRIRGSKKRIELRNGEHGANVLIIIAPYNVHPKWAKPKEEFPVSMSMNDTLWITPKFLQEMKEAVEQGTVELKSILNLHQLEGKGRFDQRRKVQGRRKYSART